MRAFFFLMVCFSVSAGDWYVSTTGVNAVGRGAIDQPLATIPYALTRAIAVDGKTAQRNIIVRGGAYYLQALSTDIDTAGANICFMGYPGETAILYGGQLQTGWAAAGSNNWYAAALGTHPSVTEPTGTLTTWQPRLLIVDGAVCTMGRWPAPTDGLYPATNDFHYTTLSGATLTYTNVFAATTNMEVIVPKSWSSDTLNVNAINTGSKTLTLSASVTMGPNTTGASSFALRNTPEAIYANNQFWWDKTNNAVILQSASDPSTAMAVVPVQARMWWFQGWSASAAISNIVISNLTFACTTTTVDGGSLQDYAQGQRDVIRFSNATNCTIDHCTFYGLGGNAVGNENSTADWGITIKNCIFRDIGCSAISFPGPSVAGLVVSNNLIYNCGLVYAGAPGILMGAVNNTICNNTISNCSGAGVLMLSASSGTIANNSISRCVTALRDMGGIYIDGSANINIIHNYVSEIRGTNGFNGGAWDPFLVGIYCDETSVNWVSASNIVLNCTRPLMFNDTTTATNKNNFYINTRTEDTCYMAAGNSTTYNFTNNVLRMTAGALTLYSYPAANINNVVKSWVGTIIFSDTSNASNPTNATSSDPLFTSLSPLVPSFQGDSPAPAMGIYPLSLSGIGYQSIVPMATVNYLPIPAGALRFQ